MCRVEGGARFKIRFLPARDGRNEVTLMGVLVGPFPVPRPLSLGAEEKGRSWSLSHPQACCKGPVSYLHVHEQWACLVRPRPRGTAGPLCRLVAVCTLASVCPGTGAENTFPCIPFVPLLPGLAFALGSCTPPTQLVARCRDEKEV